MTTPRGWLAMIAVGCLGACDGLTKVSTPDIVSPTTLYSPSGALTYRAGALADFERAFGDQALMSGVVSDEFTSAASVESATDQRVLVRPSGGAPLYYPYDLLQTALLDARIAQYVLTTYSPTPAWQVGQMYAYAGYVELFFAENMCSGIPIATSHAGVPGPTTTLSGSQLLQRALLDFDSAAAHSGGDQSDSLQTALLAAVGRSRALIDSGDWNGALAGAASVPASFAYPVAFDGALIENPVFENVAQSGLYTVSNSEGVNGLDFRSGDARLPVTYYAPGADGMDSVFLAGPVTAAASPLALATGIEAALIRAEADLKLGQVAAWAGELNALRQGAISPSMPALGADSTTSASPELQRTVMFRERAFWLFGTGHRQGDLRRLVRQYGLATEGVFPTGSYKNGLGGSYGTNTDFIPFGEATNSGYTGCINQAP